jgi:hypothetical protein
VRTSEEGSGRSYLDAVPRPSAVKGGQHWLASGFKDNDDEGDSKPQQRAEGDNVEQSDSEPTILVE